MFDMMHKLVTAVRGWGKVVFKSKRFTKSCICFFRHNGPATAAPVQEGQFWKRSETKKRLHRVAQKHD